MNKPVLSPIGFCLEDDDEKPVEESKETISLVANYLKDYKRRCKAPWITLSGPK